MAHTTLGYFLGFGHSWTSFVRIVIVEFIQNGQMNIVNFSSRCTIEKQELQWSTSGDWPDWTPLSLNSLAGFQCHSPMSLNCENGEQNPETSNFWSKLTIQHRFPVGGSRVVHDCLKPGWKFCLNRTIAKSLLFGTCYKYILVGNYENSFQKEKLKMLKM